MSTTDAVIPISYNTPPFPGLYWPFRVPTGSAQYLYYTKDIWRFTLYWTLITYGVTHVCVSLWATLMQIRSAVLRSRQLRLRTDNPDSRRPLSASMTDGDPLAADSGVEQQQQQQRRRRRRRRQNMLSTQNRALLGTNPIRETLLWVWIIPVIYVVLGGIEALLAGSLVGLVLGAVYNAGYFKMSTWMPFLWGLINVLVLILSSFSIQGGL